MADERDDGEGPAPKPAHGRRAFLQTTAAAAAGLALGGGGGAGPDGGPAGDGGDLSDGGAADGGGLDARVQDGGGEDAGAGDAGTPEDAGPPEPVAPPEDTPESGAFGLGVASGDVTPEAAILWTRYDGAAPLSLVVWEMDGDVYLRRVSQASMTPADGGFVHHEVTGLRAGARHRYAFFEMDGDTRTARSPVGRFRAAVAADAMEPLLFGACSCTTNSRSKATLEHAGGRDDLDLFLMLGDTTYNDGASTLAEFRARWADSLGSDGYRAMRASTSVMATWDDHEVDNNFDPETHDLTVPYQTFFESLPLRRDAGAPDRIWKSTRWGLTAEVFVLDCRSERLPSTGEQYLSRAQMDWLKDGLRTSPCAFKIIANSVPIGDMPFPAEADRWEGYPRAREEILSFIDTQPIEGVLWLSGDFHFASVGKVGRSGQMGEGQWEVLAGPGAQTGNPASFLLRRPQFEWSSTTNNYTTLELDPAAMRIRVSWINASGSTIQVQEIGY